MSALRTVIGGLEAPSPELTATVSPRHIPAAPTPAPATLALIVLTGSDPGRRHSLNEPTVVLGRDERCGVRLDDRKVSREHAKLTRRQDGAWEVSDLGSRNGTLVNGERISGPTALRVGDRLQVSPDTLLLFTRRDPLEDDAVHHGQMAVIGQLAAGTAHDFNSALSVILASLSHVLAMGSRDTLDPEVLECLRDARAAATSASELTGRLLKIARRRPDVKGRGRESVDVASVCDEVLHLVRRTFDRSIRIEADLAPALLVEGDAVALHQLLMNLCINARDAMPQGGTLTVSARRHTPSAPGRVPGIRVTVADTGVGMDERTRARLFEPFFTTKSIGAGTGLGLATVYEVARAHGGTVEALSTPGMGATFHVHLPLASERRDAVVREDTVRVVLPGPEPEPCVGHVLIADDDPVLRRGLGRILQSAGHTVSYAVDGLDVLRVHAESACPPDLVLLDLDMPNMGGAAAMARLAVQCPGVQVLMMSGYCDEQSRRTLLGEGALDLLGKPIDRQRLREAVRSALENARGRRSGAVDVDITRR